MILYVSVEGVLSHDSTTPNEAGRMLVRVLQSAGMRTKLLVTQFGFNPMVMREYLVREGITGHEEVVIRDAQAHPNPAWWARNVMRHARLDGEEPMLLTADPATVEEVMIEGLPVLLMASPAQIVGDWLPDQEHTIRPWELLVDQINKQASLRAERAER